MGSRSTVQSAASLKKKLSDSTGAELVKTSTGETVETVLSRARLEDTSANNAGTLNQVANPSENSITGMGYMNSILSGGSNSQPNSITANLASNDFLMTILGGYDNTIVNSLASTIMSMHGTINNPANHALIIGGSNGLIDAGGYQAMVGGTQNTLRSSYSLLAGSKNCEIKASADYGAIVASDGCNVGVGAEYSAIYNNETSSIADGALYSVIMAGRLNTIGVTNYANIIGGSSNSIGDGCTGSSVMGNSNTVNDNAVFATALGLQNTVETGADFSFAYGRYAVTHVDGMRAWSNSKFAANGDAQSIEATLSRQTTSATGLSIITGDGNRYVVPEGKAVLVEGQVIAKSSTGEIASYKFDATAYREVAGSTVLLNHNVTVLHEDDASWGITVSALADAVNVICTGAASKTINWVVTLRGTEVG